MWLFKRSAPQDSADEAPAAKRARVGDRESAAGGTGKVVIPDSLTKTQLELQLLDERCAEEQMDIQLKYDQRRQTHFDQRQKMLRRLPKFWRGALCGHPGRLVLPAEVEALEHVRDLALKANLDKRGSYEVKVVFGPNSLFKETSVAKRVTFHDATTERVEAATLTPAGDRGREILAAVRQAERSVLGWLISKGETAQEPVDGFCDVLRRDLWQDPIPYFLAYQDSLAKDSASSAANGAGAGASSNALGTATTS